MMICYSNVVVAVLVEGEFAVVCKKEQKGYIREGKDERPEND